jgi:hypothetical protein
MAEHRHVAAPLGSPGVVAVAGNDVDLHAQGIERVGHRRPDRRLVTVAGPQQDAEDESATDDDLLDVEHGRLMAGQDGEQRRGDSRSIVTGDGDQQRALVGDAHGGPTVLIGCARRRVVHRRTETWPIAGRRPTGPDRGYLPLTAAT